MGGKQSKNTGAAGTKLDLLMQDLGLFLFLALVMAISVAASFLSSELRNEFLIMLLFSFLAVLLAAYRFTILSVIIASVLTILYTSYKLYLNLYLGLTIELRDFVWLVLPLLLDGSMILYVSMGKRLEEANRQMQQQIDDLVLVDPATGLSNLKSLYLDLSLQASLVERAHFNMTLMMIAYRYADEIIKIIGHIRFDQLNKAMAEKIGDLLRTGDRLYAIDDRGTFAAVLICGEEGAQVVRDRIKTRLTSTDMFPSLIDQYTLKLDLQIAFIQYSGEKYGVDMVKFKKMVEGELQYDV